MAQTYLSYIVNTMTVNDLVILETRASAVMVLTELALNISNRRIKAEFVNLNTSVILVMHQKW